MTAAAPVLTLAPVGVLVKVALASFRSGRSLAWSCMQA
jgi:hypothetical protein